MDRQVLREERMKKLWIALVLVVGLFSVGFIYFGQDKPVEYVKVCSSYGAGFIYIPGTPTGTCLDQFTGETRQATVGGIWVTFLPYPQGAWVRNPYDGCPSGRLVMVGSFQSTDFTHNMWGKEQTPPFSLPLSSGEYISKVIMGGGFYDPRIPARQGTPDPMGMDGLCVRSTDPTVLEQQPSPNPPSNPLLGDGGRPIGCVSNGRIVNMPAVYSITATAAYPEIDTYFLNMNQTLVAGPYLYGSALVVTTDLAIGRPGILTYYNETLAQYEPMAGTLNVWVCVDGSSH